MVHVTVNGSMIGSAERFENILPCNEASSPKSLETLLLPYLPLSPGHIFLCNESNVIARCHEGFLKFGTNFIGFVMCMVYPSGHGHIVATENLGICTSRGSHAVNQPEHPDDLRHCGMELYHMEHGFRPLQHWLPSCDTGLPVLVSILSNLSLKEMFRKIKQKVDL
jgi:hypothetical protein